MVALLLGNRSSLGEKDSFGKRRKMAWGFFRSQLSKIMFFPSEEIA